MVVTQQLPVAPVPAVGMVVLVAPRAMAETVAPAAKALSGMH